MEFNLICGIIGAIIGFFKGHDGEFFQNKKDGLIFGFLIGFIGSWVLGIVLLTRSR
jgi:uncharacterized membrane protein YeaQ/YmgE (transglycosylase-associated protein family)